MFKTGALRGRKIKVWVERLASRAKVGTYMVPLRVSQHSGGATVAFTLEHSVHLLTQ